MPIIKHKSKIVLIIWKPIIRFITRKPATNKHMRIDLLVVKNNRAQRKKTIDIRIMVPIM